MEREEKVASLPFAKKRNLAYVLDVSTGNVVVLANGKAVHDTGVFADPLSDFVLEGRDIVRYWDDEDEVDPEFERAHRALCARRERATSAPFLDDLRALARELGADVVQPNLLLVDGVQCSVLAPVAESLAKFKARCRELDVSILDTEVINTRDECRYRAMVVLPGKDLKGLRRELKKTSRLEVVLASKGIVPVDAARWVGGRLKVPGVVGTFGDSEIVVDAAERDDPLLATVLSGLHDVLKFCEDEVWVWHLKGPKAVEL